MSKILQTEDSRQSFSLLTWIFYFVGRVALFQSCFIIRLFPILVLRWNYFSNWKRFFASLYIYIYIIYTFIYIYMIIHYTHFKYFSQLDIESISSHRVIIRPSVRLLIRSFVFSFPFLVNSLHINTCSSVH